MPKDANKKQSKDKKHFMKDFKAELKRVIWPTPKQLLNNCFGVGHTTFFNSALKLFEKLVLSLLFLISFLSF